MIPGCEHLEVDKLTRWCLLCGQSVEWPEPEVEVELPPRVDIDATDAPTRYDIAQLEAGLADAAQGLERMAQAVDAISEAFTALVEAHASSKPKRESHSSDDEPEGGWFGQ